jgi:threonyl-tRNA synthetase
MLALRYNLTRLPLRQVTLARLPLCQALRNTARGVNTGGEAAFHRLRPDAAAPAAAAPPPHGVISVPGFTVTAPHARVTTQSASDYMLSHPVYTREEVEQLRTDVKFEPAGPGDRLAQAAIGLVRGSFDTLTGYKPHASNSEAHYLTRIIFLETVAGVPVSGAAAPRVVQCSRSEAAPNTPARPPAHLAAPQGMVASMVRHFESLRLMRRDGGWLHTLLAEAENERMHLLTFLALKKNPGLAFRAAVLVTQGVFFNAFFLAYLLAPSICHRFVGFLEEEAVKTYTHILADLDAGALPGWAALPASKLAREYWRLPDDAMLRDVLLAIRADEAIHRDVNHVLGSIKKTDRNPFA